MKKIVYIALCIILSLSAFACGLGLDMNLYKDEVPSWSYSDSGYEKSVFSIVRKDGNGKLLGEGTLSITLDNYTGDKYSSSLTYKTLVCEMEYTHKDSGKVDTIYSKAIFENQTVYTVYSEKKATLQSSPSKNYSFVCDYTDESKTVKYATGENFENESELSVANLVSAHNGAVYDNETFYYLVRAFNSKEQRYGNFALTNLYDCYLANNVNTYSVYYRTAEDTRLNDFSQEKLLSWGVKDGYLATYQVSLSINGEMSGPPVELWYTDPNITFGHEEMQHRNKKVLAKIATTNYLIPGGEINFVTTYTLNSYTTIKE